MIIKFSKKKKNFNWLDLGCGNGEFLQSVERKNINGFGFDLNQKDIEFAKKKKIECFKI